MIPEYQRLTHKDYWDQQQENYKIKENGVEIISLPNVQVLTPTNIREISIVDKMTDYNKRNQRSLSTKERSTEELSEPMQNCKITDVPLNKRYELIQKARLNSPKPSTSGGSDERTNSISSVSSNIAQQNGKRESPKSNGSTSGTSDIYLSNESSNDSFHSAIHIKSQPKSHWKVALDEEW